MQRLSLVVTPIVIPATQNVSPVVEVNGLIIGLDLPVWEGGQQVKLQGSPDSALPSAMRVVRVIGSGGEVSSAGTEFSIDIAPEASVFLSISPLLLRAVRYLRLQIANPQGAPYTARLITLG